jgi:multidrug efflux pump subunit AcrA (membrane-fusion protein)
MPGESEITLNCDVKANKFTTILARTNGYLKKLHAEIDDVVTEGQLLAEIDTPDLFQELQQGRAQVKQRNIACDARLACVIEWVPAAGKALLFLVTEKQRERTWI